jgi:hypothetical protein
MKKHTAILMLVALSHSFFSHGLSEDKCVRGCLGLGFFAEFLWAANYLDYCLATNKVPVVYWDRAFPYYSPQGYNGTTNNAWEYYFEPVSSASYVAGDYVHRDNANNLGIASIFWDYHEYINYMYLCSVQQKLSFQQVTHAPRPQWVAYKKGNQHIYDEQWRAAVKKRVLDKFIKIKYPIQKKIDDFYIQKIANKKTIGIHLRGGHKFGEIPPVSISDLLTEANKHAGIGVQFFVATDQQPLLKKAKNELKGPVIYYDCERFAQSTAPGFGDKLDPKLGEDVLIEALLLSHCDFFIHTISHLSTAVLYFNPALKHTVLY